MDYIDSLPNPRTVLSEFITSMHQWEHSCWQEIQKEQLEEGDPHKRQQRVLDRMNQIFAKYCTPKKRTQGRFGSFQHPPEYNPETEKILEVVAQSPSRVVIYTQQGTGFRNKCRYILLRKGGKWLIDSKQWQRQNGTMRIKLRYDKRKLLWNAMGVDPNHSARSFQ